MKPLRFGIVGCGGIAGLHAKCLKELEAQGIAKLVAGAETNAERFESYGKQWNIKMYHSLADMLRGGEVDAVTVCSPSGLHGQQCIDIASAKKHVLCEKPLDLHLAKADEAIAAAKKNGVTLGCIFQQRFAPGPMKVKRAVEQGYFGKIVLAHAETPWYRAQSYYDSGDWRGTWELDGGVLANQSPHMIDRLIWLAGEVVEITDATAHCGLERNIEAETVAVAKGRLASGALATITGTTLAYNGLPQRVVICGTEGSAAFEGDTLTHFKTSKPFEEGETADGGSTPGGAADAMSIGTNLHTLNIKDFATAIQEGRQPLATGIDGRRVVDALNKIYRAAKVGPFL